MRKKIQKEEKTGDENCFLTLTIDELFANMEKLNGELIIQSEKISESTRLIKQIADSLCESPETLKTTNSFMSNCVLDAPGNPAR